MVADSLSREERSERMSRVKGKDTSVELAVRRLVHGMGYRYRLHAPELPGKPDIVFRPRKKAIFVHGCFWHRHERCKLARLPKSRQDFWVPKLEANKSRDKRNLVALKNMGWKALVIWECELKGMEAVKKKIQMFMERD